MAVVYLSKKGLSAGILLIAFFTFTSIQVTAQEQKSAGAIRELNVRQSNEIRDTINSLARSEGNADKAWAAYLIGKHSLKEFAPLLENIIDSVGIDDSWEASLVRRSALDTLIQLRETIQAEKIGSLFERLSDETLVLLSVAPDKNQEALLSLAKQVESGVRWTMINNLLAETKAPGFAAILLKGLKIEAQITVSESGLVGSGGGSGWSSIGCGGVYQVPDAFPPTAFYKLTSYPAREAIVATAGKYPIFYTRTVVQSGTSIGAGSKDNGGDEDKKRVFYLAQILEVSEEALGLKPVCHFSIAWQDNKAYLEEVSSIRQQIKDSYNGLLKQLVKSDRLTPDEAKSLEPNIDFKVEDERKSKAGRLARIPQN